MKTVLKLFLSVVAFLVITLGASAAVEIYMGEARTGFAAIIAIIFLFPILTLIWRKRLSSEEKESRQQMIERLRQMIDDPTTLPEKREWALSRLAVLEKSGR